MVVSIGRTHLANPKDEAVSQWVLQTKNVLPYLFENCPFDVADRPCLGNKHKDGYVYTTYRELKDKVHSFASYLLGEGFAKGDTLAVLAENSEEWVISDLGTMFVGGVVVPIFPTLSENQVEYILSHCEARFVLVSSQIQYNKLAKVSQNLARQLKLILINDKIKTSSESNLTCVIMNDALAKGQTTWLGKSAKALEVLESISEDDVCSIIYTSGTTSEPKGVMLTHKNFAYSALYSSQILLERYYEKGIVPRELSVLPLAHVFARMVYFSYVIMRGGCVAFAENFNTIGSNLKEVRPNAFVAVPRIFETIAHRLQNEVRKSSFVKKSVFKWALVVGKAYFLQTSQGKTPGAFLSSQYEWAHKNVFEKIHAFFGGELMTMLSAGAKLNEETAEFFCSIGLPLAEGYGLTETSPTITCSSASQIRWGSVGLALPGVQVSIADDGEIVVKGPIVMKGYYKDEAATRAAFDDDGWFHTGDLGEFDKEGFLHITGRKKDVIVMSNGKNVAPSSLEAALNLSPFIAQSVLVGDDRAFISALIVPKFDVIKGYFDKRDIRFTSNAEMVKDDRVRGLIATEMDQILEGKTSKHDKIKKFTLIEREFSVDMGEVTSTLKLKRYAICKNFAKEIQMMYE